MQNQKINEKDFDGWNEEKKKLHGFTSRPAFISEREIWWCSLGINSGMPKLLKKEKKARLAGSINKIFPALGGAAANAECTSIIANQRFLSGPLSTS